MNKLEYNFWNIPSWKSWVNPNKSLTSVNARPNNVIVIAEINLEIPKKKLLTDNLIADHQALKNPWANCFVLGSLEVLTSP